MQPKHIGFEIRSINNLIKRDVERSHPEGLECPKGVHGWAIRYFYENREKDVFQRDFEARFSIRRSTATNILKLMEKNGLITRLPCENDARLKKIVLTQKAIQIQQNIIKDISEREKRLSAGISPEELAIFFTVCDKIKANLEENNV